MLKIAFVVQRYGLEVNGGSELCCRLTAEHMAKYWDVEVLTTCAIDYMTWRNEYSPGKSRVNGVSVRRFAVDQERNIRKFNDLSRQIYGKKNCTDKEIEWMKLQGPNSTGLLKYIAEKKDYYDHFIFFTYLYASTYFGLPLVKEKAILVPTAHDEPPIYFSIFDDLFALPKNFIYLTNKEKAFVSHRFNNNGKGEIIGMGIDFPLHMNSERFCAKYGVEQGFMLYVGRVDLSKGCGELFDYFRRYKKKSGRNIKLLLIGKSHMDIPRSDDIIHLGFLPEEDKYDALKASGLLVVPSYFESLSIVTLEAFIAETPVLVNGKCLVLMEQCLRSNGGLFYANFEEFLESADFLLSRNDTVKRMGQQGKKYVENNYNWAQVEKKYIDIVT